MKDERPETISVIGAGLMGHGIALQFAVAGFEVALHDTNGEQLEKALDDIRDPLSIPCGSRGSSTRPLPRLLRGASAPPPRCRRPRPKRPW